MSISRFFAKILAIGLCSGIVGATASAQTSEGASFKAGFSGIVRASPHAAGTAEYSVKVGSATRKFLVHVPAGYDGKSPLPVLYAFHGGGGDMLMMAGPAYGLVEKSDAKKFLAVFPNGTSPLPNGRLATWNAGACCAKARDSGVDDIAFVKAMHAMVSSNWAIDPKRVYATGMSNGGMLSHRLACEMADVFAAVAPVAGTNNTLACAPSRPISIIEFHARDDDHVLYDGGFGPGAIERKSQSAEFKSVPFTMAGWARMNSCSISEPAIESHRGYECAEYKGCAARLRLCTTETGGHSWPGGSATRAGKAPPSSALSANDAMWDFFDELARAR